MIISWFSAGVSSFIATYLMRDKVDKIFYIHIDDQHPDSLRYIKDCEKVIGKPIEILQSRYKSVDEVCRATQFLTSPFGAPCTRILKKRVRKEWEQKQSQPITYLWGFDINEQDRSFNIKKDMQEFEHIFPLIQNCITKNDAHGMCKLLGIKRPVMYDMGYNNNNCIGCIKGGMGYWNKIRIDFPEVFTSRAKLEREMNHSIIKGIFLDELEPDRGRMSEDVTEECSIYCYLAIEEEKR